SPGPNCVGLTKIDTTTWSEIFFACWTRLRWPACNAPIVGTSVTLAFCSRSLDRRGFRLAIVLTTCTMFQQNLGRSVHTKVIRFVSAGEIARFALSNEFPHCARNGLLQIGVLSNELCLMREGQP